MTSIGPLFDNVIEVVYLEPGWAVARYASKLSPPGEKKLPRL